MDRYDMENVLHNVEGYFIPRPLETPEATFKRAKADCLVHLKARISLIEELSLEQFASQSAKPGDA